MTTDTAITPDNYDTPWKEAIEHHFPEFMAFYFSALMATSNSPTFGQSNSPRQDG